MKKQGRRCWRITLLKRGQERLIDEIPTTHITVGGIQLLLKMLFAKYTLSDTEIVETHLRGNVKRHHDHLHVQEFRSHDPISMMISDGSNWVHAIVVCPEDRGASSLPSPPKRDEESPRP
jgi:hypothetical protein